MVFLLLILWPIAELYVAIVIAEAIGVLPMLLLLIASFPIGLLALRSQGRVAWRRLGDAIAANRSPGREVLNGALVVLGGLLMLIPGFITDVLGILLLLPPTRAGARALLARNLHSRVVVRATGYGGTRRYDVDSTATDIDQPQLHS